MTPPRWPALPWDLPRCPALWDAALALPEIVDHDEDAPREALRRLAAAGLLDECVPSTEGPVQVRALCALRWALSYRAPLYDLMFAMQGLGSYVVTLAGSPAQRAALLPGIRSGARIGAFALTEPQAGSDVAAIGTTAHRLPDGGYRLHGDKHLISNAGLATQYVLFARLEPARDAQARKNLVALLVPADAPGLTVTPQRLLCQGHPIGALALRDVILPEGARIGAEGEGMALALSCLSTFRATVGAAALGMAQRALDEARAHARRRVQFGKALAEQQATQLALAEMATELDAAALLVLRAAYLLDSGQRATKESSMAKLHATETAQRVVDRALQLHGGLGLLEGSVTERLYREVRALRIYEGASEIQKLVIARELLRGEEAP